MLILFSKTCNSVTDSQYLILTTTRSKLITNMPNFKPVLLKMKKPSATTLVLLVTTERYMEIWRWSE